MTTLESVSPSQKENKKDFQRSTLLLAFAAAAGLTFNHWREVVGTEKRLEANSDTQRQVNAQAQFLQMEIEHAATHPGYIIANKHGLQMTKEQAERTIQDLEGIIVELDDEAKALRAKLGSVED